ncbi:CHAP domain-containing protein [Nonomuraea sp. NPDC049421]|uniref:CHAP domain-containing protein n=1 Tax=Nonomuraea sp. NPDC049421 TaxID=3155275 RepID=UPI00341B8D62
MAKHRLTAVSKSTIARAVLGAGVLASAFGVPAAAHADTSTAVAAATAAKHPASALAAHKAGERDETKITATADQVLAVARAQVGVSENASGGGTKFQQWYANSQRAAETVARDGGSRNAYLNAAWCSMFVSWVGEQTGARPQVGWDAWTVAHAKWFAANERFGHEAKPGAVVFFSWKGGKSLSDIQHVGFVVKDNHDGTISTVEGNTGNGKVEERVRPKSQVVGYGYPEYAG